MIMNAIIDRVNDTNNKSKHGFYDINSHYIVIDYKRDEFLCEMGLCQYIYVLRRSDIDQIRYFPKEFILEKLFDLDFYEDFVEFFGNRYNNRGDYRRFRFVALTNQDIINLDLTAEINDMAKRNMLYIIDKNQYFNVTMLSSMAIIEDDGSITVYNVAKRRVV